MQCGKDPRSDGAGGLNARLSTAGRYLGAALFALALVPAGARGQAIETEHLFGYTIGSDVGDVGEKEFEGSVTGRFSKQNGTFNAGNATASMEFVPMTNLRTEFTASVNSYDIAGVGGLADQLCVNAGSGCSLRIDHQDARLRADAGLGAGHVTRRRQHAREPSNAVSRRLAPRAEHEQ